MSEPSNSQSSGASPGERFQLLERIGTGSLGEVYKANDKIRNQEVAVKIVDLEDIDDDVADIQREVSMLRNFRSPNITQYYGASVLPGTSKLLIAMELLATSVGDMVAPSTAGSPLPEHHIAYILREVLNALVYLHSEHIMHRDIKASNILLSSEGAVKLSDFGVSAQLNNTVGYKRRTFVGSPLWMAPEVIEQSPDIATGGARSAGGYNEAADIWSLGITAIEMALGEPPRAGVSSFRLLFLIVREPSPVLEGDEFSAAFKDFVAQCLEKDPKNRPSAIDLLMHPFVAIAHLPGDLPQRIVRYTASRPHQEMGPRDLEGFATIQTTTSTTGGGSGGGAVKTLPSDGSTSDWDFGTVRKPTLEPSTAIQSNSFKNHVDTSTEFEHSGTVQVHNLPPNIAPLGIDTNPHDTNGTAGEGFASTIVMKPPASENNVTKTAAIHDNIDIIKPLLGPSRPPRVEIPNNNFSDSPSPLAAAAAAASGGYSPAQPSAVASTRYDHRISGAVPGGGGGGTRVRNISPALQSPRALADPMPLMTLVHPALRTGAIGPHVKDHKAAASAISNALDALSNLETAAPGASRLVITDVLALLAASTDPSLADLRQSAGRLFGCSRKEPSLASETGKVEAVPELGSLGTFLATRWRESIAREVVLKK